MKKLLITLPVIVITALCLVFASFSVSHVKFLVSTVSVSNYAKTNMLALSCGGENGEFTSSFTGAFMATKAGCWATYLSDAKKCGRLPLPQAKAVCYGAATARYASCVATAKK